MLSVEISSVIFNNSLFIFTFSEKRQEMEKHFDIKSRKPFAQKGNLTSLDTVLNDGISTLQMEKPKAAPKYKTGNRGSATPRPKSAKSLLDMDTVVRPDSVSFSSSLPFTIASIRQLYSSTRNKLT
jgi:hypothetical protein